MAISASRYVTVNVRHIRAMTRTASRCRRGIGSWIGTGKLCSERFAKLSFGDGDETHAASEDDVLRVLREDGTEELLPVAELLLP